MKHSRHDLDEKIFDFVTKSFENNFDRDPSNSIFISENKEIRIQIWKHNLMKKEKVEIFIDKLGENGYILEQRYLLNYDKSESLRIFFEKLEDVHNQDEIRNRHKAIKELLNI